MHLWVCSILTHSMEHHFKITTSTMTTTTTPPPPSRAPLYTPPLPPPSHPARPIHHPLSWVHPFTHAPLETSAPAYGFLVLPMSTNGLDTVVLYWPPPAPLWFIRGRNCQHKPFLRVFLHLSVSILSLWTAIDWFIVKHSSANEELVTGVRGERLIDPIALLTQIRTPSTSYSSSELVCSIHSYLFLLLLILSNSSSRF